MLVIYNLQSKRPNKELLQKLRLKARKHRPHTHAQAVEVLQLGQLKFVRWQIDRSSIFRFCQLTITGSFQLEQICTISLPTLL